MFLSLSHNQPELYSIDSKALLAMWFVLSILQDKDPIKSIDLQVCTEVAPSDNIADRCHVFRYVCSSLCSMIINVQFLNIEKVLLVSGSIGQLHT